VGRTFRNKSFGNRDFGRLDWIKRLLDSPESVVQAPLSASGPGGSAVVAVSANVCRVLSGTASSGSAASGVPSKVHMKGTSRGSLAGEPASAYGSRIDAGVPGLAP
jgi:hypothetical protein